MTIKKTAATDTTRKVFHCYGLGGSGAILDNALLLAVLATDDSNVGKVDVRITAIDFDANSDAQALQWKAAAVLSPMLSECAKQKLVTRVLGAMRSMTISNVSVFNSNEYGETVGSCVRRLARIPHKEISNAVSMLASTRTQEVMLGAGGYGNPVIGSIITASHAQEIRAVLEADIQEAKKDSAAEHYFIIGAGMHGATGYCLAPEVCRNLSGIENVLVLLDGGVFVPHSGVFNLSHYEGTMDVCEKADTAISGMHYQGLLRDVSGVVLRPLNRDCAPHKLCQDCKAEGAQRRHTSIEYLLGAEQILRMIFGQEKRSGLIDMVWNPDTEDRPLTWSDLGIDGEKYHRLIRKLAVGAAMESLIWKQDDDVIRHIPAIASILRHADTTLPEVKEAGAAIADVCRQLLQMFWDYSVTGSNMELLGSDGFTIEDNYRLVNIQALEQVLNGQAGPLFQLRQLSSYKEVGESKGKKVKEKAIQMWNGKATFKKALDSAATCQNIEDMYIKLFASVS